MSQDQPFIVTPLPPALSKSFQLTHTCSKDYATLYELAQQSPQIALQQLEKLTSPENANLKAFALLQLKKISEAEKLIEGNFIQYPTHFAVKINYADLRLRQKRWKEISQIFSSTDLGELYPDKNILHTSEFRGFMVLMSYYHLKLKKYQLAEQFYTLAVKADPLHPSVPLLEKQIFQFRILKKLTRIFHS